MKAPAVIVSLCLLLSFAFVACGHKKPKVVEPVVEIPDASAEVDAADAAPPSLFDRLGGKDALTSVVESFVGNVAADKRISKAFAKTTGPKLDHFKQMLVEQLCEVTGGPCKYSGKDMKEAHKGMGITEAQFNALVEDLALALEEKQVKKEDQNELLGKLAGLKEQIVEKKGKK